MPYLYTHLWQDSFGDYRTSEYPADSYQEALEQVITYETDKTRPGLAYMGTYIEDLSTWQVFRVDLREDALPVCRYE